ncbi:hypothetical protein SUGI_0019060 [Cryptomeria japonica]|nr:hypothetical protein SUGI_0019060 [Cryptomeria japonica]
MMLCLAYAIQKDPQDLRPKFPRIEKDESAHVDGPCELGLTETHQTLTDNGLHERVVLRIDGGFKSRVDAMLAAAMGANEYRFGSSSYDSYWVYNG